MGRLVSAGVVQRIELLSAYVEVGDSPGVYLVCRGCRSCRPLPAPKDGVSLARADELFGFRTLRRIFDVSGLCYDCKVGEVYG